MTIPVAFYAPLKSPDHPVPSGDRTMGRLLLDGLRLSGFAPELASRVRTFEPAGDTARQDELRRESMAEAERLARLWTDPSRRPRLWFTYHNYYKAPDHLGPAMARRLAIPYVLAEASMAGKRAVGAWRSAHLAADAATRAADAIFCITRHDRDALGRAPDVTGRLVDLRPFVDDRVPPPARPSREDGGPARLLAAAMMRPGDKLASYRILAEALALIRHLPWTLEIVGGGEAGAAVAALFRPFGDRIVLRGVLAGEDLAAAYRTADLFVWPAVNEGWGMVLLEAQAQGCPVVAGRYGGVPDALQPDRTGLLAEGGDAAAFAEAVAALIADPGRRRVMGEAAARFVAGERGLRRAAATLRAALLPLLADRDAA